jgi:hypothetical protein
MAALDLRPPSNYRAPGYLRSQESVVLGAERISGGAPFWVGPEPAWELGRTRTQPLIRAPRCRSFGPSAILVGQCAMLRRLKF